MWTQKLEDTLREWQLSIQNDIVTHRHYSKKYNSNFYRLGTVSIILGTVVTFGLVFFRDCNNGDGVVYLCDYQEWLRLAFAAVTAITTTFTGLQLFLSYQNRSSKHREAANDFEALCNLIKNTLAFPPSIRGDPLEVTKNVREIFDSIVERAPIISNDQYVLKYDNKSMPASHVEEGADDNPHIEHDIEANSNVYRTEMASQIEKERCNVRRCNYGLPHELQYQLQRLNVR